MPVGDSITEGVEGTGELPAVRVSYRQKLSLDLGDSGYAVDFVGSRSEGSSATPAFDFNHQGIGGIETIQVEPQIIGWLDANPADIILLHIGTNDVDGTRTPLEARDNLSRILDNINIWAANNNPVTVLLAKIIQMVNKTTGEIRDEVDTYNSLIETMVNARNDSHLSIVIVDQRNALTYPNDLAHDNPSGPFKKHPGSITNGISTGGYEKMAIKWFETMVSPAQASVLPKCP